MTSKLRRFTKRVFIYINVAVIFFFELACISPYLHPQKWWFISFLGLAFPFLLLAVLLFLIGWLILLRPRYAVFSAVALLLGFKSIRVFFAFHSPSSFVYTKDPHSLRIATLNVFFFKE